jgi:hypothetical protein
MKIGSNGCGIWISYSYFTFFIILNSTKIVNMFIVVIVGTFMEENVDSNGIISTKEIQDFYNVNMILRLNILLALIDLFYL